MKPGDKVTHNYWGDVEVVTPGKVETEVKLATGHVQVVSTIFLSEPKPKKSEAKATA